jgi:hypothetical protein
MTITRETLYAEVWAEPMLVVAARYKVSGSFLTRVCERLRVPRPPRGYWAQLKVSVERTPCRGCGRGGFPRSARSGAIEWALGRLTSCL